MTDPVTKTITFIEYDIPGLKAGEYTVEATQTVVAKGTKKSASDPTPPPDGITTTYPAKRRFAVTGLRFQLGGNDLVSVFPPPLANGAFDGVLPHVILAQTQLPWLRTSVETEENAPWLAVLTFEKNEMPALLTKTAADLVTGKATITVAGAPGVTGVGALPSDTISYPDFTELDYGEHPDDPCTVIDVPVDLFSRIAPTKLDLPYLAHIRETDTHDSVDNKDTTLKRAIVLGNRMGMAGADVQDAVEATAVLVSIENMGDYLPTDDNGTQAPALNGFAKIRLIVLTSWRFFVNDMDESFRNLLEHLNKDAGGTLGLTTLRMSAPVPDTGKVTAALADEATGLSGPDTDTLVGNALTAGYVPLDHQLREAGNTVSWYRGPLVPYGEIDPYITIPAPGPDALLRYDPLTGMFDASHAAAWQLGQLLALRSRAYSVALYEWKKTLGKGVAAQEELALLTQKLGGDDSGLLASFLAARARTSSLPDIPPIVSDFVGGLRLLKGVPFGYLVPDEGMLPTESLRLFSVDPNWIEALVDGAFSIGRASLDDLATDARHVETLRIRSSAAARRARTNDRPHLAALKANPPTETLQQVTGILMRSQAVRGWPTLQIDGYTTTDDSKPPDVPKLRMQHLSKDVLLCLFDGPVKMIAIHEAPEALHAGVEFDAGPPVSTTLRRLTPPAGVQYKIDPNGGPPVATVNVRADKRTVQVQSTAASIQNKLKTDFGVDVEKFTSAEFSVEFVKGVVRVEFVVGG